MKKLVLILVFLVLLSSGVFAVSSEELRDLDNIKSESNQFLSELPNLVRSFLGDWKININYIGLNETINYGVVLEDGLVSELKLEYLEDPELELTIPEKIIDDMDETGDAKTVLRRGFANKTIVYNNHGFISWFKLSMIKRFL